MKLANIIPVFKKGARNYRPVSVLPVFSKIFEKLLQKQFLVFFSQYLIKFSVRFSKRGVGTQSCLLMMLEVRKNPTDKNKAFGVLLTDL